MQGLSPQMARAPTYKETFGLTFKQLFASLPLFDIHPSLFYKHTHTHQPLVYWAQLAVDEVMLITIITIKLIVKYK